jgi:hypothetical protein
MHYKTNHGFDENTWTARKFSLKEFKSVNRIKLIDNMISDFEGGVLPISLDFDRFSEIEYYARPDLNCLEEDFL